MKRKSLVKFPLDYRDDPQALTWCSKYNISCNYAGRYSNICSNPDHCLDPYMKHKLEEEQKKKEEIGKYQEALNWVKYELGNSYATDNWFKKKNECMDLLQELINKYGEVN